MSTCYSTSTVSSSMGVLVVSSVVEDFQIRFQWLSKDVEAEWGLERHSLASSYPAAGPVSRRRAIRWLLLRFDGRQERKPKWYGVGWNRCRNIHYDERWFWHYRYRDMQCNVLAALESDLFGKTSSRIGRSYWTVRDCRLIRQSQTPAISPCVSRWGIKTVPAQYFRPPTTNTTGRYTNSRWLHPWRYFGFHVRLCGPSRSQGLSWTWEVPTGEMAWWWCKGFTSGVHHFQHRG